MAFALPNFNILCDIYRGPWLTRTIAGANTPCNLAFSRRGQIPSSFPATSDEWSPVMSLLLPPLTDVRSLACSGVEDVIECPSGSGRWYQVGGVDDIGKGFPNEHRCALLFQISQNLDTTGSYPGLNWPAPIP
jgi:hypothetical protein